MDNTAGTWHSPRTRAGGIVTAAVSLSALYLLSRYNYLLFHCSVEFFCVFAAVTIFVIAWHTRIWTPNHYLLFLGVAYLFVGIIDGTHTLAYKGMGVFPTSGANEATQLWILARYTEAFSLLAAPLFITRRMRVAPLISLYAAVSGFGLLAIWRLGIFPDCFIEGQGLTPFKIASEYVIAAVLAGAIAHLLKHRARLAPRVVTLLVAAMALTIAAEMAFTLYTDVYGVSNMVGHLLKAVSFYLVYRAVVLTSLVTPYSLVFRDLEEARARVERERDMAQQYLDIAGMILVVLDTAGRVSLINKKGADILGYPAEEIVGRDWFADFIPESQREAVSSVFQQLVAGQVQPVEYVQNAVLTRGGEERTIAWHNAVVRDQAGAVTGVLSSGEDMTERLHTEKALRESEEKYRSLFERSVDAICLASVDGTVLEANPAWLKLFGCEPSDIGHFNVTELYQDPAQRDELLHKLAQNDVVFNEEVAFRKKDGTPLQCAISSAAVRDENGNLVAVHTVEHDVTQARRAEQELRESEQRFRILVESTGTAVLLTRLDGTIVDCNDAAAEMLGYSRKELLQASMATLCSVERCTAMLGRVSRDGFLRELEYEFMRKDGAPLFAQVTAALVPLRGETAVMMQLLDVTERARRHLQLEANHARLEDELHGTLEVIQQMTEARDPYTAGHQRRVAELAVAIAREMGLPEESCVTPIRTAALVHDVGKIAIPTDILSKPARLSKVEFDLVKAHPQVGYDILKRADLPEPIPEIVLQHHERLDGSGYPQGLSGDDILPEAQILAVADVFEAMSSHRPYRPALGTEVALAELERDRGTLYSPDAVDALVRLVRDNGFRLD